MFFSSIPPGVGGGVDECIITVPFEFGYIFSGGFEFIEGVFSRWHEHGSIGIVIDMGQVGDGFSWSDFSFGFMGGNGNCCIGIENNFTWHGYMWPPVYQHRWLLEYLFYLPVRLPGESL